MITEEILTEFDAALERQDMAYAEELIITGINKASEAEDNGSLLQLLNEYAGFLQKFSRFEEAVTVCDNIIKLSKMMGLEGSIPYASSLLNVARIYRDEARFDLAKSFYDEAEAIYTSTLPDDSMLLAGFYSNKSLFLKEMGCFKEALTSGRKALDICVRNNAAYETAAASYVMADILISEGEYEMALTEAYAAVKSFDELKVNDSVYVSALYSLGICELNSGNPEKARLDLEKALSAASSCQGKNEFYYAIKDAIKKCDGAFIKGINLSECFYRECLKPELDKRLPEYTDRIAVGLTGKGSDCFGFDDLSSMDHDWGPDLCIFVTAETYAQIGPELEDIYASLPDTFKGFKHGATVSRHKRRGVFVIDDFFSSLLGKWPLTPEDWYTLNDFDLGCAVNGRLFTDPEGIMTSARSLLKKGYPEPVNIRKIAASASLFSRTAQYNVPRVLNRGDMVTAKILLADGIREAMKLAHYMEKKYPPHDKWLFKSTHSLEIGPELIPLIEDAMTDMNAQKIGEFLASRLYSLGVTDSPDDYLDHHTAGLIKKAESLELSKEKG